MFVSTCCGVETRVEYHPDQPFFYDDPYELLIPFQICSACGKVTGLDLLIDQSCEREND